MHRLAHAFQDDMLPFANMSLLQLFDILKSIPYHADPAEVEFLQRPYYTMSSSGPGGDCDDKAIALAAWAILRGTPYRFVAVSKMPEDDFHHVFTELQNENGGWIPADATYSFNVLGALRPWGKREVLNA